MNRLILSSLATLGIVALIAPRLGEEGDSPAGQESGAADPGADAPQPEAMRVSAGDGMAVARDASGQFHLEADVEGTPVRFLVDTGADVVALSVADARRLGMEPDPVSFAPVLRTASGTGYGAPVRIDRMIVAGHELADVDAVVVRGLSVSLLGQPVLRRLGPVTLSGDRLLIGG